MRHLSAGIFIVASFIGSAMAGTSVLNALLAPLLQLARAIYLGLCGLLSVLVLALLWVMLGFAWFFHKLGTHKLKLKFF